MKKQKKISEKQFRRIVEHFQSINGVEIHVELMTPVGTRELSMRKSGNIAIAELSLALSENEFYHKALKIFDVMLSDLHRYIADNNGNVKSAVLP